MQRGLPTTASKWRPDTPLVAQLDREEGITAARLWSILNRFFGHAARTIEVETPSTAEKLLRASTHWMRHTHATHALAHGVELVSVRDNLRHASVQTTSVYLHADEVSRARQLEDAFSSP